MTSVAGRAESQGREHGPSLAAIAAVVGLVALPLLLYIVMLQTFWDRGELGIDLTAGPVAIALLANGFPDSVNFLDQVQAVLAEALPQATFQRYDKGDASSQVSAAMTDDIVARCQALITAYGH